MTIDGSAKWKAINLTKGLPAFAHSLGRNSALAAIGSKRLHIVETDVDSAIDSILGSNQDSLKNDYEIATRSNHARARFKQILMACAMAQSDEVGYFTPKEIEKPLSRILGKKATVESFNDNLKQFSQEKRGKVLYQQGPSRAYQYRFRNPAMQPWVIMKGVRDGFLDQDAMTALSRPEQPDFFASASQQLFSK